MPRKYRLLFVIHPARSIFLVLKRAASSILLKRGKGNHFLSCLYTIYDILYLSRRIGTFHITAIDANPSIAAACNTYTNVNQLFLAAISGSRRSSSRSIIRLHLADQNDIQS